MSARHIDVTEAVTRTADEVAAAHADAVDREARFPSETFDALRRERLLSALVPTGFGGLGVGLAEIARATTALGRRCGSSALIFAMHHSQVMSLVDVAEDEFVGRTLADIAAGDLLVGSATTEAAVGGDIRKSSCHVERDGAQGSTGHLLRRACRHHPCHRPSRVGQPAERPGGRDVSS